MPELTFDKQTHTYRVDGIRVPSVTQILNGAGLINTDWYTAESAQRGTAVHTICEMEDNGVLDLGVVRRSYPQYLGYLDAWKAFKRAATTKFTAIEERFYYPALHYAGTKDRRMIAGTEYCIVDIKTGAPQLWHQLQTGGYALSENVGTAIGRWCVYLKPDGKFTINVHGDASDLDAFASLATFHTWKINHGVC